MAEINHLFGSCACERNQYTITIPRASTSLAHVFFDNSAANRRSQAAPVTAWLRVPLDWFHSTTYALYPDETHASIRRTYYHPAAYPSLPPTRRQFCGYCGTHLTAWNEGRGGAGAADALDVTLGSLARRSLDAVVGMGLVPREEGEGGERGGDEHEGSGLVKGGMVDDEDHIPTGTGEDGLVMGGMIDDEDHVATNEEGVGGVDGPGLRRAVTAPVAPTPRPARRSHHHRMRHRGVPFFEDMVENSPLGRIRRQRGGRTSNDGLVSEEWEIVEIDGVPMQDNDFVLVAGGSPNKRLKTGR